MANASERDGSAAPAPTQGSTATVSNNTKTTTSSIEDHPITKIPHILPHERVFPIQIGGELFNLSGASLSSDAPSYFSQYFLCQIKQAESKGEDICANLKTLYIDRDPGTFRDIALHLQGYHVTPRDGQHFVRLFADAQFYTLPKLISRLYEESIFISIGHREFQIPRDAFSDPGNSPNYFSLGFGAFFSQPEELFPGLDREGLIRPPSIIPPAVPGRSADTFAELLRLLRGYPVSIRDEEHRKELLRDARYFHFKGLEQKLIAHSISFNQLRQRDEVTIRLENVQKSGISIARDRDESSSAVVSTSAIDGSGRSSASASPSASAGWVNYARPYVDERHAELVLEIGGETTKIHLPAGSGDTADGPRAEFFRDTKARVARLFEVISTKLNLPPTTQPLGLLMASGGAGSQPASPGHTPLSGDHVRVLLPPEAAITLDGREVSPEDLAVATTGSSSEQDSTVTSDNPRKRRRTDESEEWVVKTGQWRLRIQPSKSGKSSVECVLVAVKLDAMSSELARNTSRGFLGS